MIRKLALAALLFGTTLGTAAPAIADEDIMPVRLHRYTAPLYAWNTNSHWLESKDGVALIDAQLLPSDARYLAAAIRASGKPLKGVILTHAHFDHVGGLDVLRAELGDFPIYTTAGVRDSMQAVFDQIQQYYAMPNPFGEALSDRLVMPTDIIGSGDTITIAGMVFEIYDGGPGEAQDNILAYQKDLNAIFAGDMAYPFAHFYTGDGFPTGALGQLAYIQATYDKDAYVYSGHGNPVRVSGLAAETDYLSFVIDTTKAAMTEPANRGDDGMLKPTARRTAVQAILAKYPHHDTFGFKPGDIIPGNIYGAEQEVVRAEKAAAGS